MKHSDTQTEIDGLRPNSSFNSGKLHIPNVCLCVLAYGFDKNPFIKEFFLKNERERPSKLSLNNIPNISAKSLRSTVVKTLCDTFLMNETCLNIYNLLFVMF